MLVILITIILGLFVSLITLPLGYYAPEWIFLIIVYWAIAVPSNNKLLLAFLTGIIVDIVYGQVLGISSFFYVLLIYIILRLYNSLRYMTIAQQAVVVLIFIFIKQHLLVCAYFIIDRNIDYPSFADWINCQRYTLATYLLYFKVCRRKFNIGGIN